MANVGIGIARQLLDDDGDVISTTNRLPVETEQDDAFTEWKTYPDAAPVYSTTTPTHLRTILGLGSDVTNIKEILIQVDDANEGYVMVGSADDEVEIGNAGARKGVKLNGGETLVLALPNLESVYVKGSIANQYINIAYFK